MVRQADAYRLTEDELFLAVNVNLGMRGEIEDRDGYEQHSGNLTRTIHWLFPWRTPAGVDHLLATDSAGNIWQDTLDGTFTDSTKDLGSQSGLQLHGVGFAGTNDKVYVSAKSMANVVSFDGTTWADVATIPKAKILLHRHERLFAINDTANPSRIYFSELADPETFDALDFLDCSPGDGYEINAAIEFGDDIILFKDHEIWKLTGRTPNTFALYRIDKERGCVSPKTVKQMGGKLYFFDRDTGVWAFDGANFTLISEPVHDYLMSAQSYSIAHTYAAFASEENRYHLSMISNMTFVFFDRNQGWTLYTTTFYDTVLYLDDEYSGHEEAAGVLLLNQSREVFPIEFGEALAAVTPYITTGWIRLGGPGAKARVRRIEVPLRADAEDSITVNMFRDFVPDVYKTRTFILGMPPYGDDSPSIQQERIMALDGWGDRIQTVRFDFRFTNFSGSFSMKGLTIFFTGGADFRGERHSTGVGGVVYNAKGCT